MVPNANENRLSNVAGVARLRMDRAAHECSSSFVCGNEDVSQFATEDEYEDLAMDRRFDRSSSHASDD